MFVPGLLSAFPGPTRKGSQPGHYLLSDRINIYAFSFLLKGCILPPPKDVFQRNMKVESEASVWALPQPLSGEGLSVTKQTIVASKAGKAARHWRPQRGPPAPSAGGFSSGQVPSSPAAVGDLPFCSACSNTRRVLGKELQGYKAGGGLNFHCPAAQLGNQRK